MKTNHHQFCTALLVVTVSGLIMSLTGCATVMTGKYQSIPVTSDPPGVKVRADTGETIVTPGKFNLMRNEEHTLMAECPGYEPQQLKLHNKAQGWVWGNVLLGGGIGLIVDCVSGASDELIPKEIHFNFANPQLTTREAVKAEKSPTKNSQEIPDSASYKKQTQTEPNAPITKSLTVIQCENCGHEIGRLERAYVHDGHIVCSQCYLRLKPQP
jgi:predicted RNA-binding Zn-ribbon protein involved in translation (DUF1610 family)